MTVININLTKKLALYSMLTATALIFSFIESVLPLNFGIPGIKPGLSNVVVMFSLYRMKPKQTVLVTAMKIIVSGLLFGGPVTLLYSLCGGAASLLAMLFAKRFFGIIGTGVVGGVTHNIAQIICAAFMFSSTAPVYYLPVLLISGTLSGIAVGLLSAAAVNRIKI